MRNAEELDRLRRVVYGPRPDPESVRRYALLLAEREDDASAAMPAVPKVPVIPPRRRLLVLALPVVLALAAASIVVLQAVHAASALPDALAPPALAGTTIVAYGNQRTVAAATAGTRYEAFGYTVFQPSGGSLHVALRCVGTGTVVITAGRRFPFRCTGPDHVLRLDDEHGRMAPFVVTGATTGDVVWAVRITERPLPGSTVTNRSKRLGDAG